ILYCSSKQRAPECTQDQSISKRHLGAVAQSNATLKDESTHARRFGGGNHSGSTNRHHVSGTKVVHHCSMTRVAWTDAAHYGICTDAALTQARDVEYISRARDQTCAWSNLVGAAHYCDDIVSC